MDKKTKLLILIVIIFIIFLSFMTTDLKAQRNQTRETFTFKVGMIDKTTGDTLTSIDCINSGCDSVNLIFNSGAVIQIGGVTSGGVTISNVANMIKDTNLVRFQATTNKIPVIDASGNLINSDSGFIGNIKITDYNTYGELFFNNTNYLQVGSNTIFKGDNPEIIGNNNQIKLTPENNQSNWYYDISKEFIKVYEGGVLTDTIADRAYARSVSGGGGSLPSNVPDIYTITTSLSSGQTIIHHNKGKRARVVTGLWVDATNEIPIELNWWNDPTDQLNTVIIDMNGLTISGVQLYIETF